MGGRNTPGGRLGGREGARAGKGGEPPPPAPLKGGGEARGGEEGGELTGDEPFFRCGLEPFLRLLKFITLILLFFNESNY